MKFSINVNNRLSENDDNNNISLINSFIFKANEFIQKTEEHTLQGLNPGGIYQAIWCRDAAYILQSWFYSGNIHGVLQQLYYIWSHQISHNREKIIFGRGSPERNYHAVIARPKKQNTFEGFLPTTIYNAGYCEVYGLNPDIDSTVLMINTTSWILTKLLINFPIQENNRIGSDKNMSTSNLMSNYSRVIDFVLPRMLKAVDRILTRDIDNDGLLEQNYNEDWMDTCLRAGKIVYNQACWIIALKNFSCLLSIMNRDSEAMRMKKLFRMTINAVEEKLWSENDGCYIDIQDSKHTIGNNKIITQDVLLYLVAITENTVSDSLSVQRNNIQNSKIKNKINNINCNQNTIEKLKEEQKNELGLTFERGNRTLNAIRDRVWMNEWPVNIEKILNFTAPWFLKPYFYHNRTFWPWITGIEMLARGRFNRFEENNLLLSKLLLEDDVNILAFYEWVNPKTGKGSGAYPFRTGMCCVRTAIEHIINSIYEFILFM
jgi:hypothetical protein